ncbi:MAG: amidohydrolase family protein [Xanthobacteraceae bacterium]
MRDGSVPVLTVDSHAHIWGAGFVPPAFFRRSAEAWAAKSPDRTPDMIMPKLLTGLVDQSGDDFIANMDRAGVHASMIMMIDVGAPVFGEEPETPIERQIEFYGEVQRRHRGRLFSHGYVDRRRSNHVALLRRAIVDQGLIGIGELTPDGVPVSHEEFHPTMKLAAEHGVPVQIHTRAGVWTDLDALDYSQANPVHPVHVADLARKLPDLKIVLCHAGYSKWWQIAAEAIADLTNCVLDISNWNESFTEDPGDMVAKIATWRSIVGIDRILFASDQPSGPRFTGERSHLPTWADFIRNLPEIGWQWGYTFTEEEAAMIAGKNALRFYGLG